MRRLLERSLGAASDGHGALDGGLSMRIGKPTAGNQRFSGLSSRPGRGHFSLENGLRDTWTAKFSRCARLRTEGSAPPDQGPLLERSSPSLQRRPRHPVACGGQLRLHPVRFESSNLILIRVYSLTRTTHTTRPSKSPKRTFTSRFTSCLHASGPVSSHRR